MWMCAPDLTLPQGSQTRGPRASCGPRGSFVRPAMLFGKFQMFNIYVAKCPEKRCREINEPHMNDTQCCFHPAHNTTDKHFTLQRFFQKSWDMPKMLTHVLSTSRKHTIGFLVKIFGECCGSRLYGVDGILLLLSSHCIPAPTFVSMSGVINHDRSPLVLDSDKGVCCHHFSSVYIRGGPLRPAGRLQPADQFNPTRQIPCTFFSSATFPTAQQCSSINCCLTRKSHCIRPSSGQAVANSAIGSEFSQPCLHQLYRPVVFNMGEIDPQGEILRVVDAILWLTRFGGRFQFTGGRFLHVETY